MPIDRRRLLQGTAVLGLAGTLPLLTARTAAADGAYGFGTPPAAGIHPRVVLTPDELPELRQRARIGFAQTGYHRLLNSGAGLADRPELPILRSGGTLTIAQQKALQEDVAEAALAMIIEPDPDVIDVIKESLALYVAGVDPMTSTDFTRTTIWIGLAYDWAYEHLSSAERTAVRSWLVARAGAFETFLADKDYAFGGGNLFGNWTPLNLGPLVVAALAVEGEAGYQQRWYDKSVTTMTQFLDVGIGAEGAPVELLNYFAYGMLYGAYGLNAMARRGDDLFAHPHLRNVPRWWSADMFPWGRDWNSLQDTVAESAGPPPIYELLRLAYPDDPAMRWTWLNYQPPARRSAIYPCDALLWASELDASDTGRSAEGLDLAESQFFHYNGLAYLRNGWGSDDVYFEFQSDPSLALGHAHADRNAFTLAGNGRLWAMDTGTHFRFDIGHNLVFIDGRAEGPGHDIGKGAQYGKLLGSYDNELAAGIMGDAKDAYDWYVDAEPADPTGYTLINGKWSKPYNPVERAFRSGTLVRGEHTYAVVSDDIVAQDGAVHDYAWTMLSPLGTQVQQIDATTVMLKPVDSGRSGLRSVPTTPLQVSFDLAAAGTYRVWLLTGRDYVDPTTWRVSVALDGGAAVPVSDPAAKDFGDCARPHWQQVWYADDHEIHLAAGPHDATIACNGRMQHYGLLIAPSDFDAERAIPWDPPSGSTYVSFGDVTPPAGWEAIPARSDEPRCLVRILNPADVTFTVDLLDRTVPNLNEDWGKVVRIRASVTSTEPKFRALLYPHRAGDPMPAIAAGVDTSTVTWTDGVIDTWLTGAFPEAINGAAVVVTRETPGEAARRLDVTVSLAELRATHERCFLSNGVRSRLGALLKIAERNVRRAPEVLADYIDRIGRTSERDLHLGDARLLINQAGLVRDRLRTP